MASTILEHKAQQDAQYDEHLCLPEFAPELKPPSVATYWRTVRHLGWSQIVWLGRQRLRRRVPMKLGPMLGPVRLIDLREASPFPEWRRAKARRMIETGEFNLLNVTSGDAKGIPWTTTALPRLWVYHLNYCDFLNVDLTRPEDRPFLRKALTIMADWCEQNATGTEIGWEPYPLSLRIVNWLKFLLRNAASLDAIGEGAAGAEILASLRRQVLTLERTLEFHLRGNHLLKNLKALIFAGELLETRDSYRWWTKGAQLLGSQLTEQILSDGGHFERSVMYHAEVFEDLLDLKTLVSSSGRSLACGPALSGAIGRMAEFLETMLHPDGEISMFNDSAVGVAPKAQELLARAGRFKKAPDHRGRALKVLPETGYAVIREASLKNCLIFDCGPLGPDDQPGHGHCDVLSYELSLDGQRVVVDTGASTYEPGRERQYERSTAAHNTIRVDGKEQAEIWASFRVGRRPRMGRIEGGEINGFLFVRGEHYGYRRLGIIHSRTIVYGPEHFWLIADSLRGNGTHKVESFMHFHPAVSVEPCRAGASFRSPMCRQWAMSFAAHLYQLILIGDSKAKLVDTWYAPEFGLRQTNSTLWQTCEGQLPMSMICAILPVRMPLPAIRLTSDFGAIEVGHTSIPLI